MSELAVAQDAATGFEVPLGHRSGFVALVGRPNVGKSTLFNALMQQKIAIVTPRPQTTRSRQLGIFTEPHYQMVFMDTPGILAEPRHKLDQYMHVAALETLSDADVLLWLVDCSEKPGEGDRAIANLLTQYVAEKSVILALNKIDLLTAAGVLSHTESYRALLPKAQWIHISALNQDGLPALMEMLIGALPEGPRYYPTEQITDAFERDIAAELIREQVMLQLHDEVPYGAAVEVLEFKERPNGTTYISANIYVERESHKGIVIGAGGAQLRQLGAAARQEIEEMVGGKVFLELWVKVAPKWRRDEQLLRRFGYDRNQG
jgi:GTP-binding protein Era